MDFPLYLSNTQTSFDGLEDTRVFEKEKSAKEQVKSEGSGDRFIFVELVPEKILH